LINGGQSAGYNCKEDLLDSLLLSMHVSGKFFDKKELYVCSDAEKLINSDKRFKSFKDLTIINCLDKFKTLNKDNWALSKVYVYQLDHAEPFLHLDVDAFICRPIPKQFFSKSFLFQNVEPHDFFCMYEPAYNEAKTLGILPKEIKNLPSYAFNTAVFCCTDLKHLPLLKEYYRIAEQYTKNNLPHIDKMAHGWHQCILFEQQFIVNVLNDNGLQNDYETILTSDCQMKEGILYEHFICNSKRDRKSVGRIQLRLKAEGFEFLGTDLTNYALLN
jgi:hypothetical protein